MKLSGIASALLLLTVSSWIPAHAEDFPRDVTLVRTHGNTVAVSSTASAAEKKEAVPTAVKSAIDAYIFAGIAGVGDGKPKADESMRETKRDYFSRLYSNRYMTFVKDVQEDCKPRKNKLGRWEVTVTVELYIETIDKDLSRNGVIADTTPPPDDMTIMVVPYKQPQQTYKDVLASDFDRRVAVGQVQEEFRARGMKTIDFETRYDAAIRSGQIESEIAADSFLAQIIKSSGADVYVTVDLEKQAFRNGASVGLTLKAVETATGTVLSSKVSTSGVSSTTFDRLCAAAVKKVSRAMIAEIKASLSAKPEEGNSVTLRINIGGSSYKTLDDEVGDSGFGIVDYVRSWLRKNAVNGKFHQQAKTDINVIFDNVQIPSRTDDGDVLDATDFAVALTRFLRRKGINASNDIVDGQTIYITITD